MYVVTLPASQRCLKDGPDAAERRPGSRFPTGGGTGDGHLEAHHDLQATPARPGRATRLGVRRSIVPAAPRTSYSSFFKAGGKGSLFCNGKKRSRFYSAQPNDSSNTNDLCLECVEESLQKMALERMVHRINVRYFIFDKVVGALLNILVRGYFKNAC